jgi:hypothetical protein
MKKLSLLALMSCLALALAACGSSENASTNESTEKKEEATASDQKDVSNKTEKEKETKEEKQEDGVPEPKENEHGDKVLEVPGQKVKDGNGTVELKKIKQANESVDIAPIKVTVNNLKLLHISDVTDGLRELIALYPEEEVGDDVQILQVAYDVENTQERNVDFYGLNTVVTDKGQQIDAISEDIFHDDEEDSNYFGKVSKQRVEWFLIRDEDISNVKLIFAETSDLDSYETITDKKQVEYTLE